MSDHNWYGVECICTSRKTREKSVLRHDMSVSITVDSVAALLMVLISTYCSYTTLVRFVHLSMTLSHFYIATNYSLVARFAPLHKFTFNNSILTFKENRQLLPPSTTPHFTHIKDKTPWSVVSSFPIAYQWDNNILHLEQILSLFTLTYFSAEHKRSSCVLQSLYRYTTFAWMNTVLASPNLPMHCTSMHAACSFYERTVARSRRSDAPSPLFIWGWGNHRCYLFCTEHSCISCYDCSCQT